MLINQLLNLRESSARSARFTVALDSIQGALGSRYTVKYKNVGYGQSQVQIEWPGNRVYAEVEQEAGLVLLMVKFNARMIKKTTCKEFGEAVDQLIEIVKKL